jgi:hypothetical protein
LFILNWLLSALIILYKSVLDAGSQSFWAKKSS